LAVGEEGERRAGGLVWVEGCVGEAGVVVDADEEVVPAGATFCADRAAAGRVAAALDAAELFGVDVDQLARSRPLVADDRFGRVLVEYRAAVPFQDRVHG